jgi:hypothetical protein
MAVRVNIWLAPRIWAVAEVAAVEMEDLDILLGQAIMQQHTVGTGE